MDKKWVRDRIVEIGIVPVIRASSQRLAMTAAEAVAEGGVPIVEITMTVPGAVRIIAEFAAAGLSGGTVLGAGTVLDPEACSACAAHSLLFSQLSDFAGGGGFFFWAV